MTAGRATQVRAMHRPTTGGTRETPPLVAVNDYMFEIPAAWADLHTGGRRLVTGRFRDGGSASQGPVILAIGPWLDGNPPPPRATLSTTTLLYYSTFPSSVDRMEGYQHADEWVGGAWVSGATKQAVLIAGTKAIGEHCWYGWQRCPGGQVPCIESEEIGGPGCYDADGEVCGLGPEYYCECNESGCDPDCFGDRGWWSERFDARILFYDPNDLAAVANGSLAPHVPQPYAHLTLNDHLFLPDVYVEAHGSGQQRRFLLGAVAYDSARGLLYLTELLADAENEQPLVHVWQVVE